MPPSVAVAEADHLPLRGSPTVIRDLSIRIKLVGTFAVVCVLLVVVGLISISALGASTRRLKDVYATSVLGANALGALQRDWAQSSVDIRDLALSPTGESAELRERIAAGDAAIDADISAYGAIGAGQSAAIGPVRDGVSAYRAARAKVLESAVAAPATVQASLAADSSLGRANASVRSALQTLTSHDAAAAGEAVARADRSASSIRTVLVVVMALSVAFGLALAVVVGNLISRPLVKTVEVLKGLSHGRLDQHVDVHDRSEVGVLGTALNDSITRLRELVAGISNSARMLVSSSNELTSVSASVSNSAEGS